MSHDVMSFPPRAAARAISPDDKIRIVLKGLGGDLPVSELCRREGVPTWLYYAWCLTFLEAGKVGLKRQQVASPATEPPLACSGVMD
jgi:transposase-like protein